MPSSLINALTGAGWDDPDTGERVKIPVSVVIDKALAASADILVKSCGLGASFLVVSDVTTHDVLGWQIEKALVSLGKVVSHIFPAGVRADTVNVAHIARAAGAVDAVVAVGSGTINDLCKYASFRAGKPYIVFGTAPSMNGYVSANASISVDGYKKTLPCHLPKAAFLDLDVLVSSPKRLIRSGLGDSLCRSTAQADWLLSHLLLKTPYRETPFTWLKTCETVLFENSGALVEGDREIMRLLAETLILSGLGMVLCGGSYPASQGEHIIAHSMEMALEHGEVYSYHGEQIGVTTLTMAALQHRLLQEKPLLQPVGYSKRELANFFGASLADECSKVAKNKKMGAKQLEAMESCLHRYWDDVQEALYRVMLPADSLRHILQAAGAPVVPAALGWKEEVYNKAIIHAPLTRDRFTFLDLARLSGSLEQGLL